MTCFVHLLSVISILRTYKTNFIHSYSFETSILLINTHYERACYKDTEKRRNNLPSNIRHTISERSSLFTLAIIYIAHKKTIALYLSDVSVICFNLCNTLLSFCFFVLSDSLKNIQTDYFLRDFLSFCFALFNKYIYELSDRVSGRDTYNTWKLKMYRFKNWEAIVVATLLKQQDERLLN